MATKPNIVIIGAHGLLGTYLAARFADYHPMALTHQDIDITNLASVQTVVSALAPDIIINAAAYTKVDQCETERDLAWAVNGLAPGYLAMTARACQATLIHFSTDYIFAGDRAEGYPEDWADLRPVNAYGESKLAGERAIMAECTPAWQKAYVIRTAWLYGAHGQNFVDTMLALAEKKSELKIVHDQFGSPTFASDLADQTRRLIEQQPPYGTYHCTNSGVCSWYELAEAIFQIIGKTVRLEACSSADFPRPARRPRYSILLNSKLPPLRPWREALTDYLHQRIATL